MPEEDLAKEEPKPQTPRMRKRTFCAWFGHARLFDFPQVGEASGSLSSLLLRLLEALRKALDVRGDGPLRAAPLCQSLSAGRFWSEHSVSFAAMMPCRSVVVLERPTLTGFGRSRQH